MIRKIKNEEYQKGYQAGYHAGIRRVGMHLKKPTIYHWVGEADGYADGELVYDIWYCGACDYYFPEWEEEPTWDFCPMCGEPMTDKGRMIRLTRKYEVAE